MSDNVKLLKNYLLYFLLMLLICLVGITNVFADTYGSFENITVKTLMYVSPDYSNSPIEVPVNSSYNLNQVRQMDILVNNYSFTANTHYQLEFVLTNTTLQYANKYTVTGLNGESCVISYDLSLFTGYWLYFDFQCPHATNNITISVSNSNNNYLWDSGTTTIFSWERSQIRSSDTPLTGSGTDTDNIINNNNQNTQSIINNQNQNTQDMIDSQNQNTQDIIDNQNANNQAILDDNKKNFQSCRDSYNLLNVPNVYPVLSSNVYRSFYITLEPGIYTISVSKIETDNNSYNQLILINFVGNSDKSIRLSPTSLVKTFEITETTSSIWFYSSDTYQHSRNTNTTYYDLMLQKGSSSTGYEPYGEEICTNKLDEQTNALNGLNDSINDDDIDDATSEASDFFSDFSTNTFGLTSIITAPLNLIQSILSTNCTALHLPLPYLSNKYLDLPCMSDVYGNFGAFLSIYQLITYGIIAYWVCVRIFNQVKDFKNPEHDEIEVVDL